MSRDNPLAGDQGRGLPEENPRTATRFATLLAGNGISQLLVGITFIGLARRVTAEELGEFASMYVLSSFLATALDFGSSQLLLRTIASEGGLENVWGWLHRRTRLSAAVLPFTAVGFICVAGKSLSPLSTALLAIQPVIIVIAMGLQAAVKIVRSPITAGWQMAVGNVAFLLGTFYLPFEPTLSASMAAIGSWCLTCLLAMQSVARRILPAKPWPSRNPWHGSLSFGVLSLAASSQALVLPIVSAIVGSEEGGDYAAVARWVQPVYLLPLTYSSLVFVHLARAHGYSEAAAILAASRRLAVSLAGVVVVGVVLAHPMVTLLLGESYGRSAPVLQVLLLGSLPLLIGQPISAALQAQGDEAFVARTAVVSAAGVLFGALLLARMFGALGGALAVGAGSLYVSAANAHRIRVQSRTETSRQSLLLEYNDDIEGGENPKR